MAEVEPKPKAPETAVGGVGECEVDAQHAPAGQRHDPQQRQALGAWWAAYKAERGPAQQPREDPGEWQRAHGAATRSFTDLLRQASRAADDWFDRAKGSEPPPAWKQGLEAAIHLVAGATLAGVAGSLTARLLDEAGAVTDLLVGSAIRLGVNAVHDAVGHVAATAVRRAKGDPHAALRAYCRAQVDVMARAAIAAREHFATEESGTFLRQHLTIDEMWRIAQVNRDAYDEAYAIQEREMLVGWAALLAGNVREGSTTDDIEDMDSPGILRLTIAGRQSYALEIVSARISGLNPRLRASLSGRCLGEVRPGRARPDVGIDLGPAHGLDVIVTTTPDGFRTSRATRIALAEAGLLWSGVSAPATLSFSAFVERSGRAYWIDDDADWQIDALSGADAGRYFLNHIRTPMQIIKDLEYVPLPEVQP